MREVQIRLTNGYDKQMIGDEDHMHLRTISPYKQHDIEDQGGNLTNTSKAIQIVELYHFAHILNRVDCQSHLTFSSVTLAGHG